MCPMGNDPTSAIELEREFGVVSSAEELVRANDARYSPEMKAATLKKTNDRLTAIVRDRQTELEEHLGFDLASEPVVTGNGTGAMILYVYVGPGAAHVKQSVPFADVFGNDLLKQRRQQLVESQVTPDTAAAEAAQATRDAAERESRESLRKAQEKADQLVADAQEKAQRIINEAREEAEEDRVAATQQAEKDAAEAREAQEQAEHDAAEAAAKEAAKPPKPAAAKKSAS